LARHKPKRSLLGPKCESFSKEGHVVIRIGWTNEFLVWHYPYKKPPKTIDTGAFYSDAAISPDGKRVALRRAGRPSAIVVWDLGPKPTSREILRPAPSAEWTDHRFSPDGKYLAYLAEAPKSGPAEVIVWETKTFEVIGRLPLHNSWTTFTFLPDSQGFVTAGLALPRIRRLRRIRAG
jgi:WD40 repeat protein